MVVYLLKNRSDDADCGVQDPYETHLKNVRFVPVATFELVNLELLVDRLRDPTIENIDALLVTSQRAVDVLKLALDRLHSPSNVLEKVVYTVGPTTASRLRTIGFQDIRGSCSGNGKALAADIISESKNDRKYLFLAGEVHRDYLPSALQRAGNIVQTQIVYRTQPVADPNLSEVKRGDWIIFFSPSHSEAVIDYLDGRNGILVGAIGPTTEKFLHDNGVPTDAVASSPTAESLKQAIDKYLG